MVRTILERDDLAIYIVVITLVALLVDVLAFWFYAEITCFGHECTGGAGPGNEPEAQTAPFGETHGTTGGQAALSTVSTNIPSGPRTIALPLLLSTLWGG